MAELEMITFDENGQGVVNWESLETFTSAEFVNEIKSTLNTFKRSSVKLCEILNNHSITVIVGDDSTCKLFRFFVEDQYILTSGFISSYDVDLFIKAFGGRIDG